MEKPNESTEQLKKEIRRLTHQIGVLRKENADMTKRALDAEKTVAVTVKAYNALILRAALALGEEVRDEMRSNVTIGYRLTLPPAFRKEADELIAKWEVRTRIGEDGNVIYAVGLRNDPNDAKTDAEIAAEAAERRNGHDGC